MGEQGNKRRNRYRWTAVLFCVSLLLGEIMSAGSVAFAQEPVQAEVFQAENSPAEAQQEPGGEEGDDGDVQEPGGGEGDDGDVQEPGGGEGDDGDVQEPGGGEGDGGDVQEPGGGEGDDGNVQEPGGEEGDDGNVQEPGGEEGDGGNVQEPGDTETGGGTEQKPGDDTEKKPGGEEAEEQAPSVSENSPEEAVSVSENTPEANGMALLAAEDDIANGKYGKVTWVIRADGTLIVEGEGDFAPSVPKTGEGIERAPWYAHREKIQSATVRLTGATDLSGMFAGCKNMASVELSGLRTDAVTDMSEMFAYCNALEKLDVSGFDTSHVTDMSRMFYNSRCWRLEKLDVSGFDTSHVTDMSGMFGETYAAFDRLDVSGFDTSKVTDMSGMFSRCTMLTKLDVSNFDTSNVTDMHDMFRECNNLGKLDVSSFDTSKVTDMSGMFSGCIGAAFFRNQIELDVSGLDTSSVTDMSRMFERCYALELDISGFDTSNVTNMSRMFMHCPVEELDVSGFDTSHVTDMGSMFWNCKYVKELDVSGFDTLHVTNMSGMFAHCQAVTELNVSGFDTSRVTDMGSMFSNCGSVAKLNVSGFDTSHVTGMGEMFHGCTALAKLDVSGFDTSNVASMTSMFQNCESLAELDLSGFDTSQLDTEVHILGGNYIVSSVSRMFSGCKKLERLDVGGSTLWDSGAMPEMFDGCESLTELDLSNFSMGRIRKDAYCESFLRDCKKLETFYAPHFVQAKLELPRAKDSDVWYGVIDGKMVETTEVSAVTKGRYDNVLFVRNQDQVQTEERLVAKKRKTAYNCGEALSTLDLRVTYYDAAGGIEELIEGEEGAPSGYKTNAKTIDMSTPGEKTLVVTYETAAGTALTAEVKLRVTYALTEENTVVTLSGNPDLSYTGQPVRPVPTAVVTQSGEKVALAEGTDYTVSYRNNINACPANGTDGSGPAVVLTGKGNYSGQLTVPFSIDKAAPPEAEELSCYASDCAEPATGRTLDLSGTFAGYGRKTGYQVVSAAEDDAIAGAVFSQPPTSAAINKKGVLTYSTNAGTPGDFATVKLRVSFANYKDADLTVKIVLSEEKVTYLVIFDSMGHGKSGWTERVKAGGLLREPEPLEESGYLFTGWYADRQLTRKWDFALDVVQEDVTLYAGWLSDRSDGKLQMYIQDIEDMVYTGSAIKPTVVVYDSDGVTPLRAGKDYTVKYYNNVRAGGDGASGAVASVRKPGKKDEKLTPVVSGRGAESFTKDAPYIVITGKGNYTETVYKNFCIRPAKIGNEAAAPAPGFTLKYTDQLVTNGKKEQKPLSSMKYKKAMKAGVDFRVSLEAADANDGAGNALTDWKAESSDANKQNPAIPAGYSGTFQMIIKGQGNYTGEIRRTVVVAAKDRLIKNVSVTLAKNQKSRPYTGREVTLTGFTVKAGKTVLSKERDYTVSYADNVAVGTAVMTITGKGEYVGSKSVSFKITGKKFTAGTITVKAYDQENPDDSGFRPSMPYTGSAVVQNRVSLATKATNAEPNPKQLVYGQHYTISYKNNVKKGTAAMTFTAKPESGYSGSFKKTFKITAQPLSKENLTLLHTEGEGGGSKIQAVYCKNGAVPVFILKNEAGATLKQGTDYKVTCRNNMAVTTAQTPENKRPVMTITGKGSYTGKIEVPFAVVQESLETALDSGTVQVSCTAVMKKEGMQFKNLKFKLVEGKKALAAGVTKDYTLDETNCTPEMLLAYAQALEDGTAANLTEPSVTVKATGTNYTGSKNVPLGTYLYAEKLENRNLYVVVSEGKGQNIYTGRQLKPTVAVYCGEKKAVSDAKKAKEKDAAALTAADGSYRLVKLAEHTEYTLDYGTNTVAGKNKGSVKVTGAGKYGGSVTVKFTIEKKDICTAVTQDNL